MKNIFFNSNEKRLKTGWRIFIFLIIFFSFTTIIFLVKPLFGDITKRFFLENYSLIIVAILSFGATLSVLMSRKWLDKKSFISLGLKWNIQSLKDLVFGFVLSAVMAGLFFTILIYFGLIEFNGINFNSMNLNGGNNFDFIKFMSVMSIGSLCLILLEHILVGYWEELVFRGYLFQNMIDGLGIKTAIIISCLLYGFIHYANPNATVLSSLILISFGFLRLYGYLSTKMLWLSMGMHIGWNFFQGPIFGFTASGHKKATLLQHTFVSKEQYLTGGEFGPEGSILIIPIIILVLIIMKWYSEKFYPNKKFSLN